MFVIVMNRIIKYRTNLNSILLVVYCLSILAGILHHHHYDFTDIKSVTSRATSSNQNAIIISDTGPICIILQNLVNLQTALVVGFNTSQLVNNESQFVTSSKSRFYLPRIHLADNLLRAPPTLS